MKLIAITVLGVLLLASIGAVFSTMATETSTVQAEGSPVYLFRIPATDTHGGGTLAINLAEHRFVFDGRGEPGKTYYLRYTVAGTQGIHQFASAVATSSGKLYMEGVWTKKFGASATKLANKQSAQLLSFAASTASDRESDTLSAEPTFTLSATTGPLYADLRWMEYNGVYKNGQCYDPTIWDASHSTGPIVRYYFEFWIQRADGYTYGQVYDGTNPFLTDKNPAIYDTKIYIECNATYAFFYLTVYDSAGNYAKDSVDALHDPITPP
jgi:hypothetical protein